MAISVFGATKVSAPRKNIFDLSHSVKFTANAGYLNPVACIPVVPGDTFDIKADVFCRLAPLMTPVLANLDLRLEAFYVPNRIIWPNWEKFIVFEHRPNDDPKPVLPYIDMADAYSAEQEDGYNRTGIGSLADHLGLPVTQWAFTDQSATQDTKVSALPFAAYQKIWLDYYCDKNIQQQMIDTYYAGVDGKGGLFDGDNTSDYINLLTRHHRMWRKDYFTSALPDAQRGADVLVPVNGGDVSISLKEDSATPGSPWAAPTKAYYSADGTPASEEENNAVYTKAGKLRDQSGSTNYLTLDNSDSLQGQVEGLDATITNLRTAFATQRLLELSMRVGSRLKEQLLGIFGVKSSDSRLDRAEYLGGSSVPVMIGEVAQTSATQDGVTPQANMAGKGIAAGQLSYGRKYFEEHGYLMIIASIVPKAAYFQGMPRHFKMFDYEDFYWPMFQHIGEQAIKNEEIFFGTSDENNNATFGYAPRYSEYKWLPSSIHGQFRTGSLANMHLARIFVNRPHLNDDFLNIKGEVANRAFAVISNDYDHFWCDVYFKIKAKRPMDYFGSPI